MNRHRVCRSRQYTVPSPLLRTAVRVSRFWGKEELRASERESARLKEVALALQGNEYPHLVCDHSRLETRSCSRFACVLQDQGWNAIMSGETSKKNNKQGNKKWHTVTHGTLTEHVCTYIRAGPAASARRRAPGASERSSIASVAYNLTFQSYNDILIRRQN